MRTSEGVIEPVSASGASAARRWDQRDKMHLAGMIGFVLLLNLVGWGVLLLAVAPREYALGGTEVYGVGLGVTAFLLGVRHAFDADHIAVIDNTTRKLVGEGKAGIGVGFWFGLGHSSVVFGASLLIVLGVDAVGGTVQNEQSSAAMGLGLIGSLAAGGFLLLIGLTNLASVVGIFKVFRGMRSGKFDESTLEHHLHNRGFLARLLTRATRRVTKPWHVYPVGFLMGLGFDTASQVALLVVAAGTAAFVLPWYAILVLPVLFAAGMTLFDTADGVFMSRAYGWAFLRPVRKVYYNLTITLLSVIIALAVGVIVLTALAVDQLGITSGPVAAVGSLELDLVGYGVVGLFLAAWLIAVVVWKVGRFEDRYPVTPAG
ncbi:MAG TPA: HoxN/HupN/NixA family nickel/cobalt transporter [Mycobacteriales bacterium]|nr:HoxN/HupN/NixA family nickel/cobalt transporter [Mycobacteriales bacterium]